MLKIRIIYISPVLHILSKFSDYCSGVSFGEESHKRVQLYPTTLVLTNATYNPLVTIKRWCTGNLRDSFKWDLTDCRANPPITNELDDLSNIRICGVGRDTDLCKSPVDVSDKLSRLIGIQESITSRQDLKFTSLILADLVISIAFLNNSANVLKVSNLTTYINWRPRLILISSIFHLK